MPPQRRLTLDRVFVMIVSLAVAVMVTAIVGMLLAAVAFANGTILHIPFVATFDGVPDRGASPTVTITGSWVTAGITTMLLALPLWIFALRYRREAP